MNCVRIAPATRWYRICRVCTEHVIVPHKHYICTPSILALIQPGEALVDCGSMFPAKLAVVVLAASNICLKPILVLIQALNRCQAWNWP